MVRKSILVYELLRTEQPQDGFSEKEIVEQISNKHNIVAGKGLRRQVAVALRRGLDFGILARKKNKFKFDPDGAKVVNLRGRPASKKSKKKRKTTKRATKSKQSNDKSKDKNKKPNRPMPPARVPKSWVPARRNLADEPLSKVKKI